MFGRAARDLVPNTVPRGYLRDDEHLYSGMVDGELVDIFPIEITEEVLAHGQEQYDIFCAPCHSFIGDGEGVIVQRGFPQPPSFHTERLRQVPVGYIYQVITEGIGHMYSYADRVAPLDRWAIAAYIRALQLSQNATLDDVPPQERQRLEIDD
ncbi:MAG: cytochrome c [Chloroflexota bacterium]|nr:cytochrome c [Chloroflexota bacterium]